VTALRKPDAGRARGAALRRRLSADAGETLLELLIAIVIIGITVTAVMGAIVSSAGASAEHRAIAAVDTVLKSYAENAKYQIELAPTPAYAACATPLAVPAAYSNSGLSWVAPSGYSAPTYTVSITSVLPWDGTTDAFDATGSCTDGLEQLTVVANGPDNSQDTLSIVVRKPTYDVSNASF
jgi:type II secretory pathway pseudopilin PulG